MGHPRHALSRNFKKVRYTGGDITLNVASVTDVHASALDMTLNARVGDVIEYGLSARLSAVAQFVGFDVYSIVSAARVNPFGPGISAALATTGGVAGWFAVNDALARAVSGSVLYAVQSGDLSSGAITMRLAYGKVNTTARTLFANASVPLDIWAKNLGPVDPN